MGGQSGDSPRINVWYGQSQSFGQNGDQQIWVNILGNVSDDDSLSEMFYTLNDGPEVDLTVGRILNCDLGPVEGDSCRRRLQRRGDFNIDLATEDLGNGPNTVRITAVDNGSPTAQSTIEVTINFTDSVAPEFELPLSIDWADETDIQRVGRVVDGLWSIEAGTVGIDLPGYDRLIAFGDRTWTDYEVEVPIRLQTKSGNFGAGVIVRWNGHTEEPSVVSGYQPKTGWYPTGAIAWFRPPRSEYPNCRPDRPDPTNCLILEGARGAELDAVDRDLALNTWYVFKMQVETIGGVPTYRFKVWPQGDSEPAGWDLEGSESGAPLAGSAMLIAHNADVSFGEVNARALP